MKKTYLLGMALIGSLAFQACSKTGDGSTASGESKAQVITLAVVNGSSSSTRAGRPLLSSEPNHTIENVVVYVVNDSDNTIATTKTYSDWQNESADYRTDDGRFVEFLLDDKLEDGRYRIFAVGYHNGSSYGDITGALVSAGTFNENAALALSEDKGAEEIFAGSTEAFDVVKTEGFKRPIVLNRQVAGVYVYANEIPYIAGGTQLRLVSSDENNNLILGQFANADMTDNGTGSGITTAVVNGASSGSEFDNVLATIDLGEWFTTLQDNDGDNLIDTGTAYDNWHKPAKYNGSATFEKGAVFSGEFVIPFAKVDGAQTLKLQLTTSAGEVKREYADLLREADAIFIEELRNAGLYDKVSQAFVVFLPVKSVGVMGDGRTYEWVVSLRSVETSDFMTAHWSHLPYDLLGKVSNRIINEVRGINRVVYDVSGKPPATIEWE